LLSFKSFGGKKGQENGPRGQKMDKKEVTGRNEAERRRRIEKREFLAQNFQMVGVLFILTGPQHPHRGKQKY